MSESDCLFCKIVAGDIPADIVHDTDSVLAFRDINPQAPTHVLVIPRRHIATLNDLEAGDDALVGKLFLAAREIAAEEGIAEAGYRTVMNCNRGAGQSVFHIHLHVLGGRGLDWPPG
ncbi:MAG: histidine triad nucleotide-binding protein [Woeseiaceae bacterium]|nr:histidine triad nucleotide-binding protein [Woeseiaceae bacterium]